MILLRWRRFRRLYFARIVAAQAKKNDIRGRVYAFPCGWVLAIRCVICVNQREKL